MARQKGQKGQAQAGQEKPTHPGHWKPGQSGNPSGKPKPVEEYVEPEEEKGWPEDLRLMLRAQRTKTAQDQTQEHKFWREYLRGNPNGFVAKLLELKQAHLAKLEAEARRARDLTAGGSVEDEGTGRARGALIGALERIRGK